jgi:hypothetical protein
LRTIFLPAFLLACLPGARAQEPELEAAFIFGSRQLECEIADAPGASYTAVHHAGSDPPSHDALAYGFDGRPYGFETIDPGNPDRNGSARFGPFDDSPNDLDLFGDDCPEEIYDSFIGFRDFPPECDDQPCGGIFRIDLPDGWYRFAGAFGGAATHHTHRVLVEDGGSGPPGAIGPDFAVLVENFDQAEHGAGAFARAGFGDHLPPAGDGAPPDPAFVNLDELGRITGCPPNSPALELTQGYIRVHLLRGDARDGSAGAAEEDGGDIVLFEAWRFDGEPDVPVSYSVDVARSIAGDSCAGPPQFTVTLSARHVLAPATVIETLPAGAAVSDPGGGVVAGGAIGFTIESDGEKSYTLDISGCCPPRAPGAGEALRISGEVFPEGGCPGTVAGVSRISCCPPPVGPFLRGDVNADGRADISDGIRIFTFLFSGERAPVCMAAADVNGEGRIRLTSGIYLLSYLFLQGPWPAAPFPECGQSSLPGDRELGCACHPPCGLPCE